MKKLLLLLIVLPFLGKSQASCNQSTFTPNTTFTTGAVSNHTGVATEFIYICDNADITDTLTSGNLTCHYTIVNTGSKYRFQSKNCAAYIYALGNSTITITATSVSGQIYVVKEPGVTVVNQSTLTINTTTCSAISTPTNINCSSTGINEHKAGSLKLNVYPNPANSNITIESGNGMFNEASISITNILGEVVYVKNAVSAKKVNIDLNTLQSGVYYVTVNSKDAKEVKKIVVSK